MPAASRRRSIPSVEVMRGEADSGRRFSAFYLKDGRLVAADCVNRPQDFMASKRLVAERIDAPREALADQDFDLKMLFRTAPVLGTT